MLHGLVRRLPVGLALVPARLLVAVINLLYLLPDNSLRKACENICRLIASSEASPEHCSPRRIYKQFLRNALGVLDNFFTLYRHGSEAVMPRITIRAEDRKHIQSLIDSHGGIVLAVPHNIASAFSALRIGDCFDMLLVAKNSPTIERTRIAIDFYERMPLSLLLVRDGHPIELSRAMFSCLRNGKLVAATLDNIDRTPGRVPVKLFGQTVGLSDWAARIAARTKVPVIPAYFRSSGKEINVSVGTAIMSDDVALTMQHYASFLENEILGDPASWAYLADKHWQKVLYAAVGNAAST
jgi:lauroyl/myristoyl acyltransferase